MSWIRVAGASAILAMSAAIAQGCGSEAKPGAPSDADAGLQDAGTSDGTVTQGDGAQSDDTGTGIDAIAPVDAGPACDPDAHVEIDCTGLCGPVRDACTGTVKMCGGCGPLIGPDGGVLATDAGDGGTGVLVCDLTTNTCVKPKVTCADLGAECGTAQNSCGQFLDCPDGVTKGCVDGKQCNPDTNKCEDCETVTCADLGYECGYAWLGCGANVQSTDCGQCAPDADGGTRKCNPTYNVCEPACVPASAAVICAAAKAAKGVECGIISNGCGGTVDCTPVAGFKCADGLSCGMRGIANHCDPGVTPDECVVLGKTCGDVVSVCTGKTLHCGDCATGQICNANGVCGPLCTPKTCADFAQYACGTFSDSCGATITCGTCPNGVCDQATNTCCAAKQCGTDYAGHCGVGLANGCGQNAASCPCASGICTLDGGASAVAPSGTAGSCCVPHPGTFYTNNNQCGTNLPDGCGNKVNAACPTNQECVANTTGAPGPAPASGVVGSCCTRTDSCNLASGTCGPVQDSCRPTGTTNNCNKCTTGTQCTNNACCHPAPACTGGGGETAECNDTKQPVDTGCGSARSCSCAGGRVCLCSGHVCTAADGTGACKTPLTCATGYAGKCGTALDNATGGTVNCGCSTGMVCSSTTANTPGTCTCNNPTGVAYTCANVPGGPAPGGDACGTYDNGCGGTLNCACPAGQACNTTPNPNVCCAPASCPAPGLGSACGNVTNGCTTVNCGCPSGAANANFSCTAGKCACTKDTCRGRTGSQPDLCGGNLQCGG